MDPVEVSEPEVDKLLAGGRRSVAVRSQADGGESESARAVRELHDAVFASPLADHSASMDRISALVHQRPGNFGQRATTICHVLGPLLRRRMWGQACLSESLKSLRSMLSSERSDALEPSLDAVLQTGLLQDFLIALQPPPVVPTAGACSDKDDDNIDNDNNNKTASASAASDVTTKSVDASAETGTPFLADAWDKSNNSINNSDNNNSSTIDKETVATSSSASIAAAIVPIPENDLHECLWIFTNIASAETRYVESLVPLFPTIAYYLAHPISQNILEQAMWAVGNIAGEDGQNFRDQLLGLNVLPIIVDTLDRETTLFATRTLLRTTCWALSNLFRGNPPPDPVFYPPACRAVSRALGRQGDDEAYTDALWTLCYIATSNEEGARAVFEQEDLLNRMYPLVSPRDRGFPTFASPLFRTLIELLGNLPYDEKSVLIANFPWGDMAPWIGNVHDIPLAPPPALQAEALQVVSLLLTETNGLGGVMLFLDHGLLDALSGDTLPLDRNLRANVATARGKVVATLFRLCSEEQFQAIAEIGVGVLRPLLESLPHSPAESFPALLSLMSRLNDPRDYIARIRKEEATMSFLEESASSGDFPEATDLYLRYFSEGQHTKSAHKV